MKPYFQGHENWKTKYVSCKYVMEVEEAVTRSFDGSNKANILQMNHVFDGNYLIGVTIIYVETEDEADGETGKLL